MYVYIGKQRDNCKPNTFCGREYIDDYASFEEVYILEKRVVLDGGVLEDIVCIHMQMAELVNDYNKCTVGGGELLYNHSFVCGTAGWGYDTQYPAVITDNGDNSVHLKTESDFGSVVPVLDAILPSNTYIIKCKVRNVDGNGKISIRNSANAWANVSHYTTDGTYSAEYTGNIKEIHVGADGDDTFEADYEYISLKLKN